MNSITYSATALMISMSMCGSPTATESLKSIDTGVFSAINGYSGIAGRAQLVRTLEDTTLVQLHLEGLDASQSYPAHVHVQPCAFGNGGGHYKIDPTVEGMVVDNELWPRVESNQDGVGRADIEVGHLARGDALSVVVHDPSNGNAKMACADLTTPAPSGWTAGGRFAPFASASDLDASIVGRAEMTVDTEGTLVEVNLGGLDPASTYASHVHALPCETSNAGGHYKMNPAEAGTIAFNEIWPSIAASTTGSASDDVESRHVVRGDAQSVVVHRVLDGSKPKVACANLARRDYVSVTTQGSAVLLDAAYTRGYGSLSATASMTRNLFGETSVELDVQGVEPSQRYMAHVHTYSCATLHGGGHYKIDTSVEGAVENNEIWVSFTSLSDGRGSSSIAVDHVARPEAQSVVIHDYTDKARLACIDLN